MKLFFDVIFALLPLALIALPITALLILHGVQVRKERKTQAQFQISEETES
jgi:hypothetical protein